MENRLYCVISSELKIEAKRELRDEKSGLISYNENEDPNKKIYIKTWSDIIDMNQSSLEQLRSELDLNLGEEESEEYIENNLSDIMDN